MNESDESRKPLLDGTSAPITPSAESRPVIQPPRRNDLNGSPVMDPRIASLAAMFPDFDLTILSDVLDTCNGDQDRAIEILLGMNDPSYKSKALDTLDLDEQLAHRLAAEEQEDIMHQIPPPTLSLPYVPRNPRRSNEHARSGNNVPSQAQSRGFTTAPEHSRGDGQEPGSSRTGSEIQEQFMRIAETGKRTFSNIFSKVRAKLQEYDQPANQPDLVPPTSAVPPRTQSEAYYAAAKPVVSSSTRSTIVNEGGGYDLTPAPIPMSRVVNNPNSSGIPGPTLPRNGAEESIKPSSVPTSSPSTPPPTISSLDRSKLGLLPRRPQSLIMDNPSPIPTSGGGEAFSEPPNDEDDDLYVPNPDDAQKQ